MWDTHSFLKEEISRYHIGKFEAGKSLNRKFHYRHPKETGVATVEGRPHEAVYMCFEKNYADFLSAPFMGLIRQLGLNVIYLLEGSWYKSVGKLVTSTQIRKAVSMLFERAQQSLNDENTNDGSCS